MCSAHSGPGMCLARVLMEVGCHFNQPTHDLPSGAHPDKPSLSERKTPLVRNRFSGLEEPDYFLSCLLCWVFVAVHGFSLVVSSRGCSSLRYTGSWWCLLLWSTGFRCTGFSSCGLQALEHRLNSCGARALLLRGMWDLPAPRIKPVSPALAGRFLSTGPPGKPYRALIIDKPASMAFALPHPHPWLLP